MERSTCDIRPTVGIDTVNDVNVTDVTSSSMTVRWAQTDCKERVGLILNYRIYFCALSTNDVCVGPEMNVTVEDGDTAAQLIGLTPFTRYSVRMTVLSRLGEGNSSQPVHAQTLANRPTPPVDVAAKNVTNFSLVLNWSPPAQVNGILKTYNVTYNSEMLVVPANTTEVTLSNLLGYKNYEVKIVACNEDLQCSDESNTLTIRTRIGVPGSVFSLKAVVNGNTANVSWIEPDNLGGPATSYIVRMSTANQAGPVYEQTVTGTSAEVPVPDCGDAGKFEIVVTALNEDEDGKTFHGPSTREEVPCNAPGLSLEVLLGIVFTVVIIVVVLIIAAIQIYCYMQKKTLTRRLKPLLPWERAAAGVTKADDARKLPKPSANIYSSKPNTYDRLTSVSSAAFSGPTIVEPPAVVDVKAGSAERHGRSRSGDSSGCSSGHESLSSHDTGGSRESYANDSGAEMESSSPGIDTVFHDHKGENVKLDHVLKGSLPSVHYTKPSPVDADLIPAGSGIVTAFNLENEGASPYVKVGQEQPANCREGYVTLGLSENRTNPSPSASPCLSTASNDSVHSDRQLLSSKYSGSKISLQPKAGEPSVYVQLSLANQDQSDVDSDKDHLELPDFEDGADDLPRPDYVMADQVKPENLKPVNGYVMLGGAGGGAVEANVVPVGNSHYVALGMDQFGL